MDSISPSMNITGDRTLIVRVDSQTSTTGDSGLMIRKSTANNSVFASIVATDDPQNHIFFRYRTSDGGSTSYAVKYQNAPVWLMLTRIGNSFTGYYSTDGVTWTQVGSATLSSMPIYGPWRLGGQFRRQHFVKHYTVLQCFRGNKWNFTPHNSHGPGHGIAQPGDRHNNKPQRLRPDE